MPVWYTFYKPMHLLAQKCYSFITQEIWVVSCFISVSDVYLSQIFLLKLFIEDILQCMQIQKLLKFEGYIGFQTIRFRQSQVCKTWHNIDIKHLGSHSSILQIGYQNTIPRLLHIDSRGVKNILEKYKGIQHFIWE